jgi:hypothetical protein
MFHSLIYQSSTPIPSTSTNPSAIYFRCLNVNPNTINMRFSIVAALGAATLVSAANFSAPSFTTSVLSYYTTVCPSPTIISYNSVTYTVTESTTLTITNCPCTVTMPVASSSPPPPPPISPIAPVAPPASSIPPANSTPPAS